MDKKNFSVICCKLEKLKIFIRLLAFKFGLKIEIIFLYKINGI